MTARHSVTVNLGDRTYAIEVGSGLLAEAARLIAPGCGSDRVAIVTDETVRQLHLSPLLESLRQAGMAVEVLPVPVGEAAKQLDVYASLLDRLLDIPLGRDGTVIAFGGGAVGDIAGFAAASLYRGVRLVQIPTTLLAQVDSSIGGKTGVNTRHGKNLVGAFHQPAVVIADIETLDSLPVRQLRSGYAEIAKVALIRDAEFFGWLERSALAALAGDHRGRVEMIRRACEGKSRVVVADEIEEGDRALLNLGHSFGHAIEAENAYAGDLAHGEAVAAGIVIAARASSAMGFCRIEVPDRIEAHLRRAGLSCRVSELAGAPYDPDAILERMRHDKKFRAGQPVLVLLRGIGEAFLCDTPDMGVVREALAESCCG